MSSQKAESAAAFKQYYQCVVDNVCSNFVLWKTLFILKVMLHLNSPGVWITIETNFVLTIVSVYLLQNFQTAALSGVAFNIKATDFD